MNEHVLITGGAGFIGSSLAEQLIAEKTKVTVVDNYDPFYAQNIKERNLRNMINNPLFRFIQIDICELKKLEEQLEDNYSCIVHIAAKAGVHFSIKNPMECQKVNVLGTQNMLEIARKLNIPQFVFASSSSVYGKNPDVPWKESDLDLSPISPYASSKLSCEMLGHVYAHLYPIRFIALRFFTVYGPRQRPDLAIYKFAKRISNQQPIPMYGDGSSSRDYTYISDALEGVKSAIKYAKTNFEIINLGNHRTVSLKEMIITIEEAFGKKARIEQLPEQPGDVPQTFASIKKAKDLLDYEPAISFKEGIGLFRDWFLRNESDRV